MKLGAGPRFGGFKVKAGPSSKLKTGPSSFSGFPYLCSVLGVCSKTQIVSLCAKIVFLRNCRDVMRFSNRKLDFVCFVFLCCCKRNRKRKWKKAKKL